MRVDAVVGGLLGDRVVLSQMVVDLPWSTVADAKGECPTQKIACCSVGFPGLVLSCSWVGGGRG